MHIQTIPELKTKPPLKYVIIPTPENAQIIEIQPITPILSFRIICAKSAEIIGQELTIKLTAEAVSVLEPSLISQT
jgi:hypothetical protein